MAHRNAGQVYSNTRSKGLQLYLTKELRESGFQRRVVMLISCVGNSGRFIHCFNWSTTASSLPGLHYPQKDLFCYCLALKACIRQWYQSQSHSQVLRRLPVSIEGLRMRLCQSQSHSQVLRRLSVSIEDLRMRLCQSQSHSQVLRRLPVSTEDLGMRSCQSQSNS